jgi:hypothetical protein
LRSLQTPSTGETASETEDSASPGASEPEGRASYSESPFELEEHEGANAKNQTRAGALSRRRLMARLTGYHPSARTKVSTSRTPSSGGRKRRVTTTP